ncbi:MULTISPECIES: hypothetical protein [unclassified Streptomyces]|uniref:hypothetical protein n=1 Tax=unclassified Streptomyces TaxID=2593676 RepID=UPI003D949E06
MTGFIAIAAAFGGVACWAIATAEFGWTGVPGKMAASVCKQENDGRAGITHLHCRGTFMSQDGGLVDHDADVRWDGGKPGDVKEVRTLIIGGYAERNVGQGILDAALATLALVGSVVFGFFTLSPGKRERDGHR